MLLDVAVFAPLGLLVSIGEAMPELTRKGRARFLPQIGLARTIGQFAVGQGYRRVVRPPVGPPNGRPAGPAEAAPSSHPAGDRLPGLDDLFEAGQELLRWASGGIIGAVSGVASASGGHQGARAGTEPPSSQRPPAGAHHNGRANQASDSGDGPGTATARASARGRAVPPASELAIPSYDSLSAPQVVQRLAGLSREEIEAVRRYEAATRGRRTILARAEQLLG
jgi:hypothetical protein